MEARRGAHVLVGIHVEAAAQANPTWALRAFARACRVHSRSRRCSCVTPRMRVYVMHGGYPMLDDLLALLFTHPQVYVELSMAANVETRPAFYRYLRGIVEAGYGDRVMFGSDQMVWPS